MALVPAAIAIVVFFVAFRIKKAGRMSVRIGAFIGGLLAFANASFVGLSAGVSTGASLLVGGIAGLAVAGFVVVGALVSRRLTSGRSQVPW
jgi:hypothetical protein